MTRISSSKLKISASRQKGTQDDKQRFALTMQQPEAQIRDINELPTPKTTSTIPTQRHTPTQRTTTLRSSTSASADVLLRSLELRESVEKELLHSVEKLVKLRHRGDAQQFRLHVARLKAQEQQIEDLQHRVDQKDEDVHTLRRQLNEIEQKCAAQTVQLMTVKTELHSNNVEISTDRARQLKLKDDEIQALNSHMGDLETNVERYKKTSKETATQLITIMEERDAMLEKELTLKEEYERKSEDLNNEVANLRARVQHGEAYRKEANRQISDQEDISATSGKKYAIRKEQGNNQHGSCIYTFLNQL